MLAKLIMSTLFGLLYGCLGLLAFAVTDVPDAPRMALVVGLAAFGMCLLMLQLMEDRAIRRYTKAEAQLPANPLAVIPANIRQSKRITSSSRMYLYPDEIYLVNVDKKQPRYYRIALKELKLATLHPPVEVLLKMADGRVLQLLTPRAEELLRHLRMGGCPVENQN